MSIAPTLQKYLTDQHVEYDLIEHPPTNSSIRTAVASGVPSSRVAKAVLLLDGNDFVLAVLPASSRLDMTELARYFDYRPRLATEPEIARLFNDCAPGALPPAGECYGIDVIIDDEIDAQPEVFFEGGDHVTLVHMSHPAFAQLMGQAQHGHFSTSAADEPGRDWMR